MITLESSFFWLTFVLVTYIISLTAERNNRVSGAFIVWLMYSFVVGFRAPTVGVDTNAYINTIEHPTNIVKNGEILFNILNSIVYNITNNSSIVLFVYAMLMYGLIIFRLWEMKKDISFSFSLLVFLSIHLFESLNVMRQYLAVAIIFFAVRYLQEGKYIKYILFVLIAAGFHSSALLGMVHLAVEILCWKDIGKKKKIFLIFFTAAGIFASSYFLAALDNYSHYFSNVNLNIGFKVLELLMIFIVSIFYFNRKIKFTSSEKHYLLKTTQIYYLIGCAAWAIGYFYTFMNRIAYYFTIFVAVYYGIIMKEKTTKSPILILLKFAVVILTIYMIFTYLFINNGPHHHPYHFVWNY